jgi:hypothetical protein
MDGRATMTEGVRVSRRAADARLRMTITVAALLCVVPLALASGAHAATGCANEEVRQEQGSTGLPECRAFELVTPLDVHPNLENGTFPFVDSGRGDVEAQAASGAGAIAFRTWYSPSEAPTVGQFFLSRRGQAGWTTSALTPSYGPDTGIGCFGELFLTETLATETLLTHPPRCNVDEPPLVAGEPRNVANLFSAPTGPLGPFRLVNVTPEGITPHAARFQAESADGDRVIFDEAAPLVASAPTGDDLYVWSEGVVRLVTYTPSGDAGGGVAAAGAYSAQSGFGSSPAAITHAVSSDGESVFFEVGGGLYLREHAAQPQSTVEGGVCVQPALACTVEVDRAVSGATGSSGGGSFQWADTEGTRAFFTDASRLTPGSTAEPGKPDLYEYDVATGQLADLTAHSGEAADVLGVAGAAEDGSRVYFVADGVLTTTPNGLGEQARAHRPNLYLASSGVVAFVTTLSEGDYYDWGAAGPTSGANRVPSELSSVVTSDGAMIAFNSVRPITGYENLPETASQCYGAQSESRPGSPCDEIFEYSAATGGISCVSCGRPESPPAGMAELRPATGVTQRRALMADGRVFFDTPSKLVPKDENGVSDVYEWAPVGTGECTEASPAYEMTAGGCQWLISGGKATEPSYFVDADEDGEDVYFLTTQALVAADTDNGPSLYDARVEGGYPEATATEPCEGEACRGAVGAPAVTSSATAAYRGPGNGATRAYEKRKAAKARRLAKALKACEKRPQRYRSRCRAKARRRFGGAKAGTSGSHASGKGGRR